MKRGSPYLLGLFLFACAPSSTTHVVAAEGGWVRSEDGRFALFFPPGALDADLDVTIEPLPEADWEVDAPRRFTRVSDVYRVTPRTTLTRDVYAVMELDSAPPVLVAPSGDGVLAVHYVFDGDKVRPAPFTRTVYFADGRVGIVGTLFDLGDHWFAERAPANELVQLSARVEVPAPSGTEWSWSSGGLFADHPLNILGSEVRVTAVSDGSATVAPVLEGGTERTWDARWDDDLGLHPFELFGGVAGTRSERIARASDPMPFVIDATSPRQPLADPLPGWRCDGAGTAEATLFGGVDVVSGASSGTTTTGVLFELGRASCP
ncbi:MAG: hypothetical protein KC619_02185 [Myxococcales bacterium]|nr:hypothetical protein [Myxococcales bacterium]